jgi:hypothetical protein
MLAMTSLCAATSPAPDPATIKEIKAYCLDFNWEGKGRKSRIAEPGFMKDADPAAVVAWHKTIGCNVIQTFCVSHNGYAWYRNEVTPEQPGLKHDFLREVVKLGHAEGMVVMGYFSIAANTRWGKEYPKLSYGTPKGYHVPYTDEYLAYLDAAIRDAVSTTGIDGFMIDWVWQPGRGATQGKWLEAEKKLYQQLMKEPFPGEDRLTPQQDQEYSRRAIDRCWKTIRKAAKESNPKCIVWLTCNQIHHPHVTDSDMFREVDWLMAETGSNRQLEAIRKTVGEHTRLITCLAAWNNADPNVVIPEAVTNGIGLYGFCRPSEKNGTISLDKILNEPLTMFHGDERNISALARAYHGKSLDAVWNGETFVEPARPPTLRLQLPIRRRGVSDVGRVFFGERSATVETFSNYHSGEATLTRLAPSWPAMRLRLYWRENQAAKVTRMRITNGALACEFPLQEDAVITWGTTGNSLLGADWAFTANQGGGGPETKRALVRKTPEVIEVALPEAFFEENPEVIAYEWLK